MTSTYPGVLDNWATDKTNSTFTIDDHPQHHNDLADAINKIQAELGPSPSGTFLTLGDRISALSAPGVFDVQDPTFGGISDTDSLHNNSVVQAVVNAAAAAGGGVVFFSPRPNGYRLRPRATQAVSIPSGVTIRGSRWAGRIVVTLEDTGHTLVNGAQTLDETAAGTLIVDSTAGFEDSGQLFMRETSPISGTYTAKTATAFLGVTLGASTTTDVDQTLPQAIITVDATTGFPPLGGVIKVAGQTVNYTGLTQTSFTGCTGGTGAIPAGSTVECTTAYLEDNTGVGQSTQLFQNSTPSGGNSDITIEDLHIEGVGNAITSTIFADLAMKAIRIYTTTSNTTGPSGYCDRIVLRRNQLVGWCGPQFHLFNLRDSQVVDNIFIDGRRGAIVGGHGSQRVMISRNTIRNNIDDCINWAARTGGTGAGHVFPTYTLIANNFCEEEDPFFMPGLPTVFGNLCIRTHGGQYMNIIGNICHRSATGSSRSAAIHLNNDADIYPMWINVVGNTVIDSNSNGIMIDIGSGTTGGTCRGIKIVENIIKGSVYHGVSVYVWNSTCTLADSEISRNTIIDCGSTENYRGIAISGVAGCTVAGVLVENNQIIAPGGSAIAFTAGPLFLSTRVGRNFIRNPHRVGPSVGSDPLPANGGSNGIDGITLQASCTGVDVVQNTIVNEKDLTIVRDAISAISGVTLTNVRFMHNRARAAEFRLKVLAISGATQVNVRVRDNFFEQGVPSVASAATLNLNGDGLDGESLYTVSGSVGITDIAAGSHPRLITLHFTGSLTVTDGNHLKLAGNFVVTTGATLTLYWDGTDAWETGRAQT